MKNKLIVALDASVDSYKHLSNQLSPSFCAVKVGKELFTSGGPKVIETLLKQGFEIFLDLKYHDIPNTVAGAIRSAHSLGVQMVNVHCLGGRGMMEAAAHEAAKLGTMTVIGVTVLTSLILKDLRDIGFNVSAIDELVLRLARLAMESGLDGVVCSGEELPILRATLRPDFKLVVPGIRLPSDLVNDQQRIMTPQQAMQLGADHLVVGRPITTVPDVEAALFKFNEAIGG
jgi:orotidine-5'-phosphate decarboxylase